MRCATCAKPLPKAVGKGRPKDTCRNDHCEAVFICGHNRERCARCRSKILPLNRTTQQAAICGRCFVDLCDLASIQTH